MIVKLAQCVQELMDELSDTDAGKIMAHIKFLEDGRTEALVIKPLRNKVKELVIPPYRVVFFKIGNVTYIVDIFRKKSQKTPKRIVDNAWKTYRTLSK